MISIIMFQSEDSAWTVICNERWQAELTSDETLGTIAAILYGKSGARGYLRTDEEHRAYRERLERMQSEPIRDPMRELEQRIEELERDLMTARADLVLGRIPQRQLEA